MTTRAPADASALAASAPMPAAPPVMTTVLPAMSRPAAAASAAVVVAERGPMAVGVGEKGGFEVWAGRA